MDTYASSDELICSFCGKRQSDVGRLVAGPRSYICDECIELCLGIVAEQAWYLRLAYRLYLAVAKVGYCLDRAAHPRLRKIAPPH